MGFFFALGPVDAVQGVDKFVLDQFQFPVSLMYKYGVLPGRGMYEIQLTRCCKSSYSSCVV